SGFGNGAVGKSGSGSAWAGTGTGGSNPARRNTASSVDRPTPWSGVYTAATSRAPPGATSAAAPDTYAPIRSPPTDGGTATRGTTRRSPTAAIRAAISPSTGGAIWAPSSRYTL